MSDQPYNADHQDNPDLPEIISSKDLRRKKTIEEIVKRISTNPQEMVNYVQGLLDNTDTVRDFSKHAEYLFEALFFYRQSLTRYYINPSVDLRDPKFNDYATLIYIALASRDTSKDNDMSNGWNVENKRPYRFIRALIDFALSKLLNEQSQDYLENYNKFIDFLISISYLIEVLPGIYTPGDNRSGYIFSLKRIAEDLRHITRVLSRRHYFRGLNVMTPTQLKNKLFGDHDSRDPTTGVSYFRETLQEIIEQKFRTQTQTFQIPGRSIQEDFEIFFNKIVTHPTYYADILSDMEKYLHRTILDYSKTFQIPYPFETFDTLSDDDLFEPPTNVIKDPKILDACGILGVDYYAIVDDINLLFRAYRNLAKQYHPDVNQDEDAKEKFQRINGAYMQLKDHFEI